MEYAGSGGAIGELLDFTDNLDLGLIDFAIHDRQFIGSEVGLNDDKFVGVGRAGVLHEEVDLTGRDGAGIGNDRPFAEDDVDLGCARRLGGHYTRSRWFHSSLLSPTSHNKYGN